MSDLEFQYVAGVHPVAESNDEPRAQLGRAWDAVEPDDPTNQEYWRHAGRLTNELLVENLRVLQDRSSDEYLGNPIVEGVIAKHVVDVVGDDAPRLSVVAEWGEENEELAADYSNAFESLWKEVADEPTTDGEDSFGDWIGTALTEDWLSGGTTDRIVSDPDVSHPIRSRLQSIDILRRETPPERANDPNTLLGIRRTPLGRPVTYYFADNVDNLSYGAKFDAVPAREIIHGFLKRRRGLVSGYPLLSGVLGASAELRQLDQSVVDAAFNAALMSVFAYTTSDLVDTPTTSELSEPIKFKRRGVTRLPAHYQLNTLQAQRQGLDTGLRKEFASKIGRPAAMPGLSVNMDASGHNYSSARFDDRPYVRAVGKWRRHCERRRMNPYTSRVAREAELRGLIPPRLGPVRFVWQWQQSAGIDPVKDANAAKIRLGNFSTSPFKTASEEGNDFEQNVKEWAKAREILTKHGLGDLVIAGLAPEPEQESDDEE